MKIGEVRFSSTIQTEIFFSSEKRIREGFEAKLSKVFVENNFAPERTIQPIRPRKEVCGWFHQKIPIENVFFGMDEASLWDTDENQQELLKDPLHVPVGPITRARSKKIKEALNGLIQGIWADSTTGHNKLGPKEDEGIINLIQASGGADHA